MLKSKRFWITVTAVLSTISAALAGNVTWPLAIQTAIAAIAAFVIGE